MMDYIIVAVVSGLVGVMCGSLGSIHYIVTHPDEFQQKVEEKMYS